MQPDIKKITTPAPNDPIEIVFEMRIYGLNSYIEDFYNIPCCPLCDQPVDEMDEKAIGRYSDNDDKMLSFCLIHKQCGDDLQ